VLGSASIDFWAPSRGAVRGDSVSIGFSSDLDQHDNSVILMHPVPDGRETK
jgi:hypothetical protein